MRIEKLESPLSTMLQRLTTISCCSAKPLFYLATDLEKSNFPLAFLMKKSIIFLQELTNFDWWMSLETRKLVIRETLFSFYRFSRMKCIERRCWLSTSSLMGIYLFVLFLSQNCVTFSSLKTCTGWGLCYGLFVYTCTIAYVLTDRPIGCFHLKTSRVILTSTKTSSS